MAEVEGSTSVSPLMNPHASWIWNKAKTSDRLLYDRPTGSKAEIDAFKRSCFVETEAEDVDTHSGILAILNSSSPRHLVTFHHFIHHPIPSSNHHIIRIFASSLLKVLLYSKTLSSRVQMSSIQDWRIRVCRFPQPASDPLYLCNTIDKMEEPSTTTSTSTSAPWKNSNFRRMTLPKHNIAMQNAVAYYEVFPAAITAHISPIEQAIKRPTRSPTAETYPEIKELLGGNSEAEDVVSFAKQVVDSAKESYLKGRDMEKNWQKFWEDLVYAPTKEHESIVLE